MQGKILEYKLQESQGIVSGNDGVRYTFVAGEIKTKDYLPQKGDVVDFEPQDKEAKDLYLVKEAAASCPPDNKGSGALKVILVIVVVFFVIVIIGILAAVAIPKLAKVKEDAAIAQISQTDKNEAQSSVNNLKNNLSLYQTLVQNAPLSKEEVNNFYMENYCFDIIGEDRNSDGSVDSVTVVLKEDQQNNPLCKYAKFIAKKESIYGEVELMNSSRSFE
jgi:hypothetical protein